MSYALQIGMRHLRSKKRSTVSTITFIAVAGVALGVAAFLTVLCITTGFQKEFRDKILGVNAHVLVMKYGVDFDEYRDVIARAEAMPEVAGVGPFLINEMMLAKGDRLAGVLVKGVDPVRMPTVLDLPQQITHGSLDGLRLPDSRPPTHPDDLGAGSDSEATRDNWNWLEELTGSETESETETGTDAETGTGADDRDPPELEELDVDAVLEHLGSSDEGLLLPDGGLRPGLRRQAVWDEPAERAAPDAPTPEEPTPAAPPADDYEPLPEVEVASPEDVESLLDGFDPGELDLPEEWDEALLRDENEMARQDEEGTRDLPGIVVGSSLARDLGLGVGDRVRLVSPLSGLDLSMVAPEARAPQSRDFRVIAIFQAGFQEYDTRLVYTDLFEAQRFYGQGDAVTGVEMRLHDLEQSPAIARQLERELGGPFHTLDWAELNRNLFTALEIQKVTLGFIIAMIILVAALNVVATLIMIVLDKKREIAILKAMGATDTTILGIFVFQGSVIGVIGTAVGLLLGGGIVGYLSSVEFPLDPKVYLIDHLPVVVHGVEFVITAVVALAICTLATIAPSFYAARMLPVEGFRND